MSVALERKYPSTYPSDAVAILDAMSFSEGDDVKVIGSMSLRSQLYAGDYDADEEVKRTGKEEQVLKDLATEFKDIIERLKKIPKAVIGDIKCGSVEEYRVLPTQYKDFHTMASLKVVEQLPITEAEKKALVKKVASIRTEMDFILLKHDIKYHIVRWTPSEVLAGHKKVQDGSIMTLERAFQCPSAIKVDVIGWVSNNHYTEFAMVYTLYCNGKPLNDVKIDIETELKEAIKYYQYVGNPFKALKRRFALARLENDRKEMERLSVILNSDLGKIYSILSDVGTLILLFEEGQSKSVSKNIEYEVNSFKERLSHIYTIPSFLSKEEAILKDLDALLDTPSLAKLEMLEGLLLGLLKKHTPLVGGGTHRENFLKAHNLPDKGYSLAELSKISYVPLAILKEVAKRGYGAYNTKPSSVRLKGSYVKGVNAPMKAKLSPSQWSRARVFSFLDGNPNHDNDLRRQQ